MLPLSNTLAVELVYLGIRSIVEGMVGILFYSFYSRKIGYYYTSSLDSINISYIPYSYSLLFIDSLSSNSDL